MSLALMLIAALVEAASQLRESRWMSRGMAMDTAAWSLRTW